MRTKLTSVLLIQPLSDGDENVVSALIPAGLPVQEAGKPGKFEISHISHDDSRVDPYAYEYWFNMGITLDRSQVESGYPIPQKVRWEAWLIGTMVLVCFVFPLFILVTLLTAYFLNRRIEKIFEDEWGPKNLPPEE